MPSSTPARSLGRGERCPIRSQPGPAELAGPVEPGAADRAGERRGQLDRLGRRPGHRHDHRAHLTPRPGTDSAVGRLVAALDTVVNGRRFPFASVPVQGFSSLLLRGPDEVLALQRMNKDALRAREDILKRDRKSVV